jgi:hypothetical protein
MFKISCIVDDRRLPDVLRACSGKVYNLDVVPADADDVKPSPLDKPKAADKTKGSKTKTKDREIATGNRNFIQELAWLPGHQFRGADIAKSCSYLGLKKSSNWYVMMNELKAGRIRRVSAGLYEVV